jgi:probable rRNA maturation factor
MKMPRNTRMKMPRSTRITRINVQLSDGLGRPVRAPGLAVWLASVAPAGVRGDLAIALVSDARMRALNRQFRRRDKATDVLSFPSGDPGTSRIAPPTSRLDPPFLGDLVIGEEIARRQAREAGHSYAVELKVLALHGLLHLLGYDHHDPADGGRMARLERRLRAKGGLGAGLIERVEAPAARARRRSASARGAAAERARAGVGPREPR